MTTVMETLEINTINQNTERIPKDRTKTFIEEQYKFCSETKTDMVV